MSKKKEKRAAILAAMVIPTVANETGILAMAKDAIDATVKLPVADAANAVVAIGATVSRLLAIARTARATNEIGERFCTTGSQRAFAVMLQRLCIDKCNGNVAVGTALASRLCVHAFGYSDAKQHAAIGETSASGMVGYMRWAKANSHAYQAKFSDKCKAVEGNVARLFATYATVEGYHASEQPTLATKPE